MEKILVPIDGSDTADEALRFAMELAERFDAETEILNVVQPLTASFIPTPTPSQTWQAKYTEELRKNNEKMLKEVLEKAKKAKPELEISKKILIGRPARKIVAEARDGNFDLIVMGKSGIGGFERLLLGSVSHEVLNLVEIPVITLKNLKSEGGEILINKILVPIDGSDTAHEAMEYALDIADQYDASVELLNVADTSLESIPTFPYPTSTLGFARTRGVNSRVNPPMTRTTLPPWVNSFKEKLEETNVQMLDEALKNAKEAKPELEIGTKALAGQPAEKIVEASEEGDFDLIVMGSKGLGDIKGMLLGSVSNRVANNAKVPVMIVK
jgi:nucleotide-binding universal stress UspA family protein